MITRRHFLKLTAGLGAAGVSSTAYGFGEPLLRLRVTRYNLSPPQWPAGFKLKIAAIADLHACDPWMSLERIERIVERTNALKPDIVVMLGDYVAGHRKVTRFIPANEWAAVLAAPLGVHAVLGNHDWWEDKDVQRAGHGLPVAGRAPARLVTGLAVRPAIGLWPYPQELRRHRLRRAGLQHHAVPARRSPGNRAGDAGRGGSGGVVTRQACANCGFCAKRLLSRRSRRAR